MGPWSLNGMGLPLSESLEMLVGTISGRREALVSVLRLEVLVSKESALEEHAHVALRADQFDPTNHVQGQDQALAEVG